MEYILKFYAGLSWFRARLIEPSTWAGVGGAVAAAAVVPAPLNYAVFACSLAALILKEVGRAGQ